MPKIIEDKNKNLLIYIYTNDHIPAHVHVFKGKKQESKEIKINIGNEETKPSLVYANAQIKSKDIIEALKLVAKNQEMLLKKWQEIHGI